jgi:hypothetical protein
VMYDLTLLLSPGSDWTITEAFGIDAGGDIVGTSYYQGENYAVELMDPSGVPATPEPLSALMLGSDLTLIALLLRLRRTVLKQESAAQKISTSSVPKN